MVIAGAALITIAAILTDHLGYALIFGLVGAGLIGIEWATRRLDD